MIVAPKCNKSEIPPPLPGGETLFIPLRKEDSFALIKTSFPSFRCHSCVPNENHTKTM